MAKRYFGLDIGPLHAYLAVLDFNGGELSNVQLLESHSQDLAAQLAELTGNLAGDFKIGDRVAAALPAKSAYIRQLDFPFSESKKIQSALPFSLSSQIPVAVDECLTASLPVQQRQKGPVTVTAAAVPSAAIQEVIAQAESCSMPLHVLDLEPFALLSGLGDQLTQGILLTANSSETTLSLVSGGRLLEYRLLPQELADRNLTWLDRELALLTSKSGPHTPVIYCVGDAVTPAVMAHLLAQDYQVKELTMAIAGRQIPMKFMPATALALRAGMSKGIKSFNLRQGSFALKGEWQKLKKSLWGTAILAVLILGILATAAGLKYRSLSGQADRLQSEMVQIYRETFPNATTIVDVPLQMRSAITELREKNSLVGDAEPGALAVLKQLSEQVDNIAVQIDEFNYNPAEVRVSGNTTSFEAVNKLAEQLTASSFFTRVQVADAQMALRGNKINFRLILTLAQGGIEQ